MKKYLDLVFILYVVSLATSMSGMELFSTVLAIGVVLSVIVNRHYEAEPKQSSLNLTQIPFLIPLSVFIVIVLIGIFLGDSSTKEKLYDIQRMRFFILYPVLYLYMKSGKRNGITPLACIVIFVGIYAAAQHFIPLDVVRPEGKKIFRFAIQDEHIGPLVIGTFNHHLTFANIYLFYACIFFGLGVGQRRPCVLMLGILLFIDCLWTQSRAAWIAVPISIMVIAAGKGKKATVSLALLSMLALFFFYRLDSGFRERFDRTFVPKEQIYNLSPRFRLWRAQWEMFKDHPWFGMGYNNNERRAKLYVDRLYPGVKDPFYGHAHSTPFQLLSTTGLLGVLAYLWLWATLFLHNGHLLVRCAKETPEYWLALALLAAFIGFHLQGLTQWNFGDAEVLHNLIFFWAILASITPPKPSKV